MATGPFLLPLTGDAGHIYVTSNRQVQQHMAEVASSCIINLSGMSSIPVANSTLYEQDFFTWTQTTAALLRAGKVQDIDVHILAEEIESMGKRDRRALRSQLQRLVMHLLKWAYQPSGRSNSWRSSIRNARTEMQDILEDSKLLRDQLPSMLVQRYPKARAEAIDETGITDFPQNCPWTDIDELLRDDFFPEAHHP